jgi:hemerythrin-like domain-containing protein
MDAIETLMSEHRLILRALGALEAFAEEVRLGGGDQAELGRFVTFLREYADGLHHAKEEEILFTAMVEAGFPRQSGPVGVMLAEHDAGRRHVAELAGLAAHTGAWGGPERDGVLRAAGAFAALLRAHIQKEDTILYPLAEQRLPAALAERVDRGCRERDEAREADGSTARLEQLAGELTARHGPGREAA